MLRWCVATLLLLTIPTMAMPMEAGNDPAGDMQGWTLATAPQGVPAGFDSMDLRSLTVEELPEHVQFVIEVEDLAPAAEAPIAQDVRFIVGFTHNDQSFIAVAFKAVAEQHYYWGFLLKSDFSQNRFTFIRPLAQDDITADPSSDTVTVRVLRSDITDSQGAHPMPGRHLTDFWAFADTRTTQGFIQLGNLGGQPLVVGPQYGVFDALPDTGNSTLRVPITMGLQQTGDALLWSPIPIRASNGEANTFVYTVRAEHHGDADETYELAVSGAPSQWDVIVPYNLIQLGPGDVLDVPVIVTTPFAHQHGKLESMLVTMTGASGNHIGRAELGIRYHEVPQPAGHHDRLWFHSQRWGEEHALFPVTDNLFSGNSGNLFINTIETDPNDQGVPINGIYQGHGCHVPCSPESPPHSRYTWQAFLQPGLEMGLDFDLTRTGQLDFGIRAEQPIVGGQLWGTYVYWKYFEHIETWQRIELANLRPQAVDMGPGEVRDFSFEVQFNEVADLLPFTKQSFFGLELNMSTQRASAFTGHEAPQFLTGSMELPLFEYQDAVDDVFSSVAGLRWHVLSDQERPVNSGEVVVFEAMLHNELDRDARFLVDLAGSNADWAWIEGGRFHDIPAGGDTTLRIAVRAPDRDGERADLVLSAAAQDDPALRSLVRFVAVVDDSEDYEDEAPLIEGPVTSQDSPGLPMLAMLGALLVGLLRRRS